MANYTQTNIYRKQMNKLNLNAKQYAELTGMPYEVVKDILYNKKGDYSMEIKNLLRTSMFNKHQEIENDFDNTKFKAMEIKTKDNINYLDWYKNVYNIDLLKNKLKINSINEFEKKYCIIIDGKKASHWFYSVLVSNREYDGHQIQKDKKLEFVKQLYDIIENDNANEYKGRKPIKTTSNNKSLYVKWYKSFDVKKFMKENNLNNVSMEKALRFSPSVISRLINKRKYSDIAIQRLYEFVKNNYNQYIETKESSNFDYFEWYKNYDLKEFMLKKNLTNEKLGKKLGLGIVSISNLANKKFYTKNTLVKLYKYLNSINEIENKINKDNSKDEIEILDDEQDDNNTSTLFECKDEINDEIETLDTIDALQDNSTSDKVDNSTHQIEIEHDNNAILRMILANRLTDEEKLLIELFGGKIC